MKFILQICCIILFIFPKTSASHEPIPHTSPLKQLQVLTYNWRPLNYEENGEIKGSATDVVKKTLDRSGLTYTIKSYPWQRTYAKGQSEPSTLIYTVIRTPQREKLFKWVRQVAPSDTVYVYRLKKMTNINPMSLKEMKAFRLGVTRDSMKHQFLLKEGFIDNEEVFGVNNNELIINMLLKERIDLIAYSENNIERMMSDYGSSASELVKLFPMLKTKPYMAMSLYSSNRTLKAIQEAYDQLVQEKAIPNFD